MSCNGQDLVNAQIEVNREAGQAQPAVRPLRIDALHKDHDLVRAAHAMVHAHMDNETMLPALEDVREQFPDVSADFLICLWIGINAKDREGLVGGPYGLGGHNP